MLNKNKDKDRNKLMGKNSSLAHELKIGKWKLPYKKFVYEKPIVLKYTNLLGNTYYDNFITWQGEARELLLLTHPDIATFFKDMQRVKMITHSTHHLFKKEAFFGDVIRIEVTTREIKHCSFVMIFRFFNNKTNELLGEGWQKICFSNNQTERLCNIPQAILDLIEPIKEDE
jgi:enediyne core biosynthesis thioesterase